MRTFEDLQKEQAAAAEEGRCRTEFAKLCDRLPTLVPCDANFAVFMQYFTDTMKFDWSARRTGHFNDPALVKMLAVRPMEQVEADRKQAVIDHNEKLKAKTS